MRIRELEREPENEVPETFLEVIRWKAGTFPQEAPIARRAGGLEVESLNDETFGVIARRAGGLEDLGGTDKGVSTIARRAGGLGTTKFMVSGPPSFLRLGRFRRGRRPNSGGAAGTSAGHFSDASRQQGRSAYAEAIRGPRRAAGTCEKCRRYAATGSHEMTIERSPFFA